MTQKSSCLETLTKIILALVWIWEYAANIWYTARYFLTVDINSDFAGDAVLAKHLADSGRYIFSSDWFPTTELYVIHHQIIMTPLFKIFGDYDTTWTATSVVAFFLMSAAIFYFMKKLGATTIRSMLAVVLFVNPVMKFQMSFSVWFHGYLFYYLLAFVIMGILFAYCTGERQFSRGDTAALLVLSFLSGLCGLRMFMIVFAPIVLTLFIDLYNRELDCLKSVFVRMTAGCVAIALAGFAVYSMFLVPKYGNGSLLGIGVSLNGAEHVNQNILSIPRTVIDGLNIDFAGTDSIYYAGVILIELLIWIVILANNIYLLIRRDSDKKARFIALFAMVNVVVNIAFMVLTQSHDEMLYRYRYFSLSTFVQIPLFALTVKVERPARIRDLFTVAVIAGSICSIALWQVDTIKQYGRDITSWRQPYIDFLVENGYEFGVSTYWNADTTIFASNGEVAVAPVNNDSEYSFFEWNTQRSFEGRTPEFVLLTNDEYSQRTNDPANNILYTDDKVTILEYPN